MQRSAFRALLALLCSACAACAAPDEAADVQAVDRALHESLDGPVDVAATLGNAGDVVLVGELVFFLAGELGEDGGGLWRVGKGGGKPERIVSIDRPRALVFRDGFLYWGGMDKIGRVRPDGAGKLILVGRDGVGNQGLEWPGGLAVDAGRVYWVSGSQVRAVPRAGGAITILAGGLDDARGLALDDTHLYVSERAGTDSGLGRILRLAKSGGALQVLATGQSSPHSIAVDATHVYWGNIAENEDWWRTGGSVRRVPKTGGTAQVLFAGAGYELALNGGWLYFTGSDTILRRLRPSGGATTFVVSNEHQPLLSLAFDSDEIFWTNGWLVRKMPLADIQPSRCAPDSIAAEPFTSDDEPTPLAPAALTVHGTWIFYGAGDGNGDRMQIVWRNGGAPIELAWPADEAMYSLDADLRGAFWLDTGGNVNFIEVGGFMTGHAFAAEALALQIHDPTDLSIDPLGRGAYVTSRDDETTPGALGAIWQVFRDAENGERRLVQATRGVPVALQAFGTSDLVWAEHQSDTAGGIDTSVWRMHAFTPGSARLLFTIQDAQALDLRADASGVYLATTAASAPGITTIWRSPLSGTAGAPPTPITKTDLTLREMALSAGQVIFTTTDLKRNLMWIPKTGGGAMALNLREGRALSLDVDTQCVSYTLRRLDGRGVVAKTPLP